LSDLLRNYTLFPAPLSQAVSFSPNLDSEMIKHLSLLKKKKKTHCTFICVAFEGMAVTKYFINHMMSTN